jgi:predicted phage terminase large subunit-like protein
MKIHNREIKRLSVSMPPRAGKSYITSLFCAWTLGKKPRESVMRNTCTARLYEKFSYDVRNIVKSQKFKEVFPEAMLADDKQGVTGWNLQESKQVGYFGAGVGGTIIGFGASALAITDDLYKSLEDALSDTVNEKVHSWKESAHDSRLESGCPQIDIGTRWTKKDVIGHNTEQGRYDESVVIPALINDKSFCEDVKTTEEYLQIKREIDPVIFDAEYMQEPIEAKGVLFPKGELNYYRPSEQLVFESSLAYCDVADEGSDYLSMPVGKNIKERIYITDVVFTKENADVGLALCAPAIKKNEVKYCRVESNSMGAMFARNLSKLTPSCQILQAVSTSNKHTRILMDAGFIKRYCYFIHPEDQSQEYKKFMEQLHSYLKEGKSKHDDAPDSLSGLVIFVRAMLSRYY